MSIVKKPDLETSTAGEKHEFKGDLPDVYEENKLPEFIMPTGKSLLSGRLFLEVVEQEFSRPQAIIEDAYHFLHSDLQYIETDDCNQFAYTLKAENLDNIPDKELDLLTRWTENLHVHYASAETPIDIKLKIDFFCALYIFIVQDQTAFIQIQKNNLFSNQVPLLWFFYKFGKYRGISNEHYLKEISINKPELYENIVRQADGMPNNLYREQVRVWYNSLIKNLS